MEPLCDRAPQPAGGDPLLECPRGGPEGPILEATGTAVGWDPFPPIGRAFTLRLCGSRVHASVCAATYCVCLVMCDVIGAWAVPSGQSGQTVAPKRVMSGLGQSLTTLDTPKAIYNKTRDLDKPDMLSM